MRGKADCKSLQKPKSHHALSERGAYMLPWSQICPSAWTRPNLYSITFAAVAQSRVFKYLTSAPRLITDGDYDPRVRYLSNVSCALAESTRHLLPDPFHTRGLEAFGSCYLVRHVMKQPWQLNWIQQTQFLFPLHEMSVSDSESSTVALEMSLAYCWRAGERGGWLEEREGVRWGHCVGGWHVLHPSVTSPSLYAHTSSTPCPLWTFTFSSVIGVC